MIEVGAVDGVIGDRAHDVYKLGCGSEREREKVLELF